jgi:hypothetical protein
MSPQVLSSSELGSIFLVRLNTYSLPIQLFILLQNLAFRDIDEIKQKSTLILLIILLILL